MCKLEQVSSLSEQLSLYEMTITVPILQVREIFEGGDPQKPIKSTRLILRALQVNHDGAKWCPVIIYY